jgi:hypothetical protein
MMGKIRKDAADHTDMQLKESERERERQREEKSTEKTSSSSVCDATCNAVTFFCKQGCHWIKFLILPGSQSMLSLPLEPLEPCQSAGQYIREGGSDLPRDNQSPDRQGEISGEIGDGGFLVEAVNTTFSRGIFTKFRKHGDHRLTCKT